MKPLFLFYLVGWLLPQAVCAQLFNKFEPGYYVLTGNQTLRLHGNLKLRDHSQLVVKDVANKTFKFNPLQVASFRIGSRKYITTSGFQGNDGFGSVDSVKAFVEQLDSGRVMLLRYTFLQGTTDGAVDASIYLLQWPDEHVATPAEGIAYLKGHQNFRESMRPFFNSRSDLLKLLEEKRITTANLKEAVHALNNNLPFTPPPAVVMPSSLTD